LYVDSFGPVSATVMLLIAARPKLKILKKQTGLRFKVQVSD